MGPMLSVALNTFRESVRSRVLFGIGLLALVMFISALVVGALSFGEEAKIVADWGLFCTTVFGLLIVVALGVQQIHKEVERKTLYAILAKPIGRTPFLLGKHAGMLALVALTLLAMTAVHQGLMVYTTGELAPHLLVAGLANLLLLFLLAAVATFFSTVASPFLSGLFTLGVFLAGRSAHHLKFMIRGLELDHGAAADAYTLPLEILYLVLPNFAVFDIDGEVVHALPLPDGYLAMLLLYTLGYSAILLAGAALAFSRRDLQ